MPKPSREPEAAVRRWSRTLYFVRRGDTIVILLCGGDKGSQDRDIERAVAMAREV